MLERLFGGDEFAATSRALDAAALRQEVTAHNLANVNTPGFKRQEVQFETQLSHALAQQNNPCSTGATSVENVQPTVVTISQTGSRADGNNVDLEAENVKLAENTLRFETLSQVIAGNFSSLKSVIAGR